MARQTNAEPEAPSSVDSFNAKAARDKVRFRSSWTHADGAAEITLSILEFTSVTAFGLARAKQGFALTLSADFGQVRRANTKPPIWLVVSGVVIPASLACADVNAPVFP